MATKAAAGSVVVVVLQKMTIFGSLKRVINSSTVQWQIKQCSEWGGGWEVHDWRWARLSYGHPPCPLMDPLRP